MGGIILRIEHIAIWSGDIDRLKEFYIKYFGATSNDKYKIPLPYKLENVKYPFTITETTVTTLCKNINKIDKPPDYLYM